MARTSRGPRNGADGRTGGADGRSDGRGGARAGKHAGKHVALAFPIGVPHTERITRGLMEYARGRDWEFVLSPEAGTMPIAQLSAPGLDGALTFITTSAERRAAERLSVPLVNLSSSLSTVRIPTVTVENRSVGRVAAEHFIARGLRHFGYYGMTDVHYSRERGLGFTAALRAVGFDCSACLTRSGLGTGRARVIDRRTVEEWLRRLPLPAGVLAVHDYRGRVVIEACAAIGIRVPEDVAVIGVDNDVTMCELTSPSLSSVALPGFEIGYGAAELLDGLMRGAPNPRAPLHLPARELVVRGSTDAFAFGDPVMSNVTRLIESRLGQPLTVADIARAAGVTRRLLERRFRATLGTSPHDYIRRIRVEHAKRVFGALRPVPLKEIAAGCGFPDVRSMNLAFRQLEGLTAAEYRDRQQRRRGDP